MTHETKLSTTPLSLDQLLAEQPDAEFPPHGGITYLQRLTNVAGYLNENVHNHVEKGALVQGDGFLTDHGPKHIKTVIQRAGALLGHPTESYPQLSPYEVYLLLMAVHFHDVGNLYGRAQHETQLGPIMDHLGLLVGTEMVEKQAIKRIASAHGGRINGNKDTISTLLPVPVDPLLGRNVRYQSLAAILRFADELSDDCHRAARVLQVLGVIPRQSEVFHSYARALTTVQARPEERVIILRYSFTKAQAILKYGKGRRLVYLLDEIYERTLKMHFERQYCMRFTPGIVRIDAIDVRIEVFADEQSMMPCVDPIGYRLQEKGYPGTDNCKIRDICPEVTLDGKHLNGLLH